MSESRIEMKENKKEQHGVRIDLDEDWKLYSDSMQWILYKKAESKTNKTKVLSNEDESESGWTKGFYAVGFFATLENALRAYLDAKLRSSAAKSIKELYDNQQKIIQSLNEVLKPFKITVNVER